MQLKVLFILASLFLISCSGIRKIEAQEAGFTDFYFQKYVGGTEQSGINAVYFISLPQETGIEIDSLLVDGLDPMKPVSRNNGIWIATSNLVNGQAAAGISFNQGSLYFHKGHTSYVSILTDIPEREAMMLPSAGENQEPQ